MAPKPKEVFDPWLDKIGSILVGDTQSEGGVDTNEFNGKKRLGDDFLSK